MSGKTTDTSTNVMEDAVAAADETMLFANSLISDVRYLLWVVTIGGIVLAAMSIIYEYDGALAWISVLTGLPWASHATVSNHWLDFVKCDRSKGSVAFEAAKAANFKTAVSQVVEDHSTNVGTRTSTAI